MSFSSNTSAFGLKPATTSAFGQQSAFGSSTPAAPAAGTSAFGSFGQPQSTQQQNQPSTFGQPTPAPTTSLFGQQPQQQQQSTSLFGQPQQQQSTTSSLFGQKQQQPTASLFGQPSQQPQPASTSAFGGGSLFGQPTQQQQPQPASTSAFGGGSLFGQPAQPASNTGSTSLFGQPSQPATGSSSLFGSTPAQGTSLFGGGQSTTGSGSSLFGTSALGQTQQQQQQQQGGGGGGLFGGSTTQPTGFGGTSLFNKPQQSQAAPQQNVGAPLFTKTTKFNDMPQDLQQKFQQIQAHIEGRVQISKELSQRKLGEEPTKSHEQLRAFHKELVNTISVIRADVHHTKDLKAKTDQAVEDTIVSMRIIDAHKNQQPNHTHLRDHASFPYEFFNRLSQQMKERLVWCQTVTEQIERKLASTAHQTQYTPHGISMTLQAQHATFLALASKTAVLDSELQKIKGLYTQLWRQKTGSVRDPFNELDSDRNVGTNGKSDLGLSGLRTR